MEKPSRDQRGQEPEIREQTYTVNTASLGVEQPSTTNDTTEESETRLTNSQSLENILEGGASTPANATTEVLHNNTEQFPSEDQSSVLFPLPANSEDIQNENHLALTRVVDNSIWEIPVGSNSTIAETSQILSSLEPPCCSTRTEDDEGRKKKADTQDTETEPNRGNQLLTTHKETETDLIENPMSEPHCVHVIAEWPTSNADFEVLSKLDDEFISHDPFLASHQVSDIFDPKEWFLQLSDEDIPPERRLRHNPGQFCLTRGESWTYFETTEDTDDDFDEPNH